MFPNDLSCIPIDRDIDLYIDSRPISIPQCRMALEELREFKAQIQEIFDKRFIHPSNFLYGAPILFVKKNDGSMRICIDIWN